MTDPAYEAICQRIWALYQEVGAEPVQGGGPRNILFPPPRRDGPVAVLLVGISPNQRASVGYVHTYEGLKDLARKFEYVSGGGGPAGLYYDSYYQSLLWFVQRVNKPFGVWWQVERGTHHLLVEFTDAFHIATDGADDLKQFIPPRMLDDPVRRACKEILEMEVVYYEPKVVIGSGRLPSDLLWEICTGNPVGPSPTVAMIPDSRFGCSVHLSGFITSKSMDAYSKARLVRELKEHSPFAG
jgi:hypothetical protein